MTCPYGSDSQQDIAYVCQEVNFPGSGAIVAGSDLSTSAPTLIQFQVGGGGAGYFDIEKDPATGDRTQISAQNQIIDFTNDGFGTLGECKESYNGTVYHKGISLQALNLLCGHITDATLHLRSRTESQAERSAELNVLDGYENRSGYFKATGNDTSAKAEMGNTLSTISVEMNGNVVIRLGHAAE